MYGDDLLGDPQYIEEEVEEVLYLEAGENEDAAVVEQDGEEGAGPTSDTNSGSKATEPKKKRVVQHPQPKLNPERLTGPRGLVTIEDSFRDFKFLGKGHEKEDLNQVMKRLELWCHRLYPRFQFDDCLAKIEALGHKKPVMTYVKKIRMGMITAEEPMILNEEVDVENGPDLDDQPPIDEFDALISQQLSSIQTTPKPPAQPSSGLTSEQRERMLRNRLLAEEKRLARLKAQKEKETKSAENSSQSVACMDSQKDVNSTETASATSVDSEEMSSYEKLLGTAQDITATQSCQPEILPQTSLETNTTGSSLHLENLQTVLDEDTESSSNPKKLLDSSHTVNSVDKCTLES
ncbi:TIMELESS-interacting protein [Anabrus simplex]|uniref:TIMELESS-interacting protein n=1 Tax=Anabrus simplex TaxID=316456 RepID=UPI0035A39F3C